jgi:hypothetical protein
MPPTLPPVAVGVFDTREQAERAVEALRAAGFEDAQLGIGARPDEPGASGPPTWQNGAAVGGMTGAALGGLAAGPPGMAAGGLVGLLLGALIDLGIPEQDARWYSDEAGAGRVIVTVRAGDRLAEARSILHRHGAHELAPNETSAAARS